MSPPVDRGSGSTVSYISRRPVAADASRPIGFGDARVGSATLAAAALVAQQVVGKALRDTLFLAAFGVQLLPYAMIATAFVSAALVIGLSRAAVARSPRRIARGTLLVSASLFLLAWLLSGPSPRGAAAVTYLHAGALSAASVSVFWSLVSESFDPYTARASVPRILAGATLGGVLGGLATWRAATWLAPAELLPLGAALNAAAYLAVSRLHGRRARALAARDATGWRALFREVPILRKVALLVFAAAATQAVLDYLLSSTAVATLGEGPPLLSFFALFQTAVGVLSFLIQTSVSRGALERFGVGAVLAASPSVLVAGVLAALVAPPLVGAVIVRGADGVLGASLHRSAYEVLFAPVEPRRKRAAKPLLDVLFDRLGMLLGGGVVAVVVAAAPGAATMVLLAFVAAVAVVRVFLAGGLQAGYRSTLADNLRHGRLGLSGTGVLDRGTVGSLSRATGDLGRASMLEQVERFRAERALAPSSEGAPWLSITAFDLPAPFDVERVDPERPGAPAPEDDLVAALRTLRSGDAARIRAALGSRRTEPLLAPQVVALLGDDRVAREAADWLTAQEPPPVGLLTDALLADAGSDHQRRRVARLLGKFDDPRAAEGLIAALPVVPTGVRPGLAHALARAGAKRSLPREPLLAAVARAAANGIGSDEHAQLMDIFRLLAAAYPGEPVQPALRALERGGNARGTALEWLDVLLPHEVKLALWPRLVKSGERIVPTRDAEELRQALRRH
jgi:ATP:ADP antiporter, AAA family